jgi:hypothetical protein
VILQYKIDICDKITRSIIEKLSDILRNAKISDEGLQNLNIDFNSIYDLFCKFLPEKNFLEIQLVVFLKQIFYSPISDIEHFRELIKSAEEEKKTKLDAELVNLIIKKRKNMKLKIDKH